MNVLARRVAPVLSLVLALAAAPGAATAAPSPAEVRAAVVHQQDGDTTADGRKTKETPWRGRNAFEVWEEEHRWFRLGIRFHGFLPAVDENSALGLGAGVSIPLSTDFFMGLGMKLSFTGSWNQGKKDECYGSGEPQDRFAVDCDEGAVGGVDYTWRQPVSTTDPDNPGRDLNATAGASFVSPQRRPTHVGMFALTIGGGYEVTIPNLDFFRVFQPFVGGGVVLAWVYTWSDLNIDEAVVLDPSENDLGDPDNIDPWSSQGPEVGGEVYGGFHINLDAIFRMVFEFTYLNVEVGEAPLEKATAAFEAKHLPYRLSQFKFGWGIEFRF